jgi:hypothetical protein
LPLDSHLASECTVILSMDVVVGQRRLPTPHAAHANIVSPFVAGARAFIERG